MSSPRSRGINANLNARRQRSSSPHVARQRMADSNNSQWSFSTTGSSGASGGNLFGQPVTDMSKPAGGLFGSLGNTPAAASSGTSQFGNTSTAGGSSLFGNTGNTSGQSQPSLFSTSNLFGGGNKVSQSDQPSSTAAPTSVFPSLSTPSKPAETFTTGQSQTSNLFGGGGKTGNFFGNASSNASTAAQASTTTPTSKPMTNLFANSTTPAGPPPGISAGGTGASLFRKPAASNTSLFGTNTDSQPSTQNTTSSSFPSFNFASSNTKEPAQSTKTTQPSSVFESTSSTRGSDLFSQKANQPEGGLFQSLNKTQDTAATTTSSSQPSQAEPAKAPGLFNLGNQPTSTASISQSTSAPAFSFPKPAQAWTSTANSVAPPPTSQSSFNSFSVLNKPSSTAASTPSAAAPLFSSLGNPQDKAPAPTSGTASTTTPSTSTTPANAPTPSLFSNLEKPTTTSTATMASGQTATAGTGSTATSGAGTTNTNLGASTAGPTPPAQSRLKNKSMDDIITRWASDLAKYQKEFQQQAEKVATWDRMLVENSEKIQKLYGSTLEAERATTEVERQLTAVENDQAELEQWLDYYEKEVDSMIASSVSQDGSLSGPDQERERT